MQFALMMHISAMSRVERCHWSASYAWRRVLRLSLSFMHTLDQERLVPWSPSCSKAFPAKTTVQAEKIIIQINSTDHSKHLPLYSFIYRLERGLN